MKMKFGLSVMAAAGIAAAALSIPGIANALPKLSLDDFNGPPLTLSVDSLTTQQTAIDSGPSSGILGQYRDVKLEFVSGGSTSEASIDFTGNGLFIHQQGGAATISKTTLVWDGFNNGAGLGSGAGLGGINPLYDALEIVLTESDAGVEWLFTLEDADSLHTATVSTPCVAAPACPGTPGPQTLILPFSAFSDFGNLNLSTLRSVTLLANNQGTALLDVTVDSISIVRVPEPATLGLLGAGLLGFGLYRRRRA